MPMPHTPPSRLGSLPKGWPLGVSFLDAPRFSDHLTSDALHCIRISQADATGFVSQKPSSSPCPLVRIGSISDPAHPACGQFGLFASRQLAPDSFILHYVGFVHGPEEADEASDYDNSLDRDARIGVDATTAGNEARFINDYRGISTAGPNAEFRDCWVDVGRQQLEKRIGVYVLSAGKSGKRSKGIAKGEEILVSYGKGFWQHQHPAGTLDTTA